LKNSHRIPARVLMPLIEDYLATQETAGYSAHSQNGDWDGHAAVAKLSPETVLALDAGILPDSFGKITSGKQKTISFEMVDALLCAMNIPFYWYTHPELRQYYWPQGQVPPDFSKPIPCANRKCETWMEVPQIPTAGAIEGGVRSTHRVYCSHNCKAAGYRQKSKRHNRAVKKSRNRSPESREAYNAYMREYRARKTAERAGAVA
jgi:hypothetical protein